MASPVICIKDTSIGNGQLMIKDLWPNRSQANPVLDPVPQGPRYLRVTENETPVVANNAVTQTVKGLTAYLLTTIDAGAGGANPSVVQATQFANAILAVMRAGGALDDIDGILDGEVAGTGLAGTGASTATTHNILLILGGASFVVSAGTSVNNSYLSENAQASAFNSSVYFPIDENDSSFYISLAQGDLSKAKSAFVSVYSGTGTVL